MSTLSERNRPSVEHLAAIHGGQENVAKYGYFPISQSAGNVDRVSTMYGSATNHLIHNNDTANLLELLSNVGKSIVAHPSKAMTRKVLSDDPVYSACFGTLPRFANALRVAHRRLEEVHTATGIPRVRPAGGRLSGLLLSLSEGGAKREAGEGMCQAAEVAYVKRIPLKRQMLRLKGQSPNPSQAHEAGASHSTYCSIGRKDEYMCLSSERDYPRHCLRNVLVAVLSMP